MPPKGFRSTKDLINAGGRHQHTSTGPHEDCARSAPLTVWGGVVLAVVHEPIPAWAMVALLCLAAVLILLLR